jgi:hypothetical protein
VEGRLIQALVLLVATRGCMGSCYSGNYGASGWLLNGFSKVARSVVVCVGYSFTLSTLQMLLDRALWLSHVHKVLSGLAPSLATVCMIDESSFKGLDVRTLCGLHEE